MIKILGIVFIVLAIATLTACGLLFLLKGKEKYRLAKLQAFLVVLAFCWIYGIYVLIKTYM